MLRHCLNNTVKLGMFALVLSTSSCKKESLDGNLGSHVERISLLVDYETGYGGYIYPVYNPYVFFKNGTVVKEPKIPINELNLDALTTDQAVRWGTWQRNGNKVQITYSNGNTADKDWPGNQAYPAKSNESHHGTFSSISGGGNLAFGGDVGILNYSRMSFTSDGWYTTERISGSNSSSHTAYQTNTTSGRYKFDGSHSITLTANNGQVKRFFFCWYSKDGDRVFRLGGRTFTRNSD